MPISQCNGENVANTKRSGYIDALGPNTQTVRTARQVSCHSRSQSVVTRFVRPPHQLYEGLRLTSRGRVITAATRPPSGSTPVRKGDGSGLTGRDQTREVRTSIRTNTKAAGQPGLRKKVGD